MRANDSATAREALVCLLSAERAMCATYLRRADALRDNPNPKRQAERRALLARADAADRRAWATKCALDRVAPHVRRQWEPRGVAAVGSGAAQGAPA